MGEMDRIRSEYTDRALRFAESDIYSWFNKAHLFSIQQRQKVTFKMLKSKGITDLKGTRILEVGSGNGRVLAEFLAFGALPENLYGVDLLFNRVLSSSHYLPGSKFVNADGQSLPFPSETFNIVLQYTALSSILDSELCRKICEEMVRVLNQDGLILSYDFWWNPTNKQTRGLRLREIRASFPDCLIDFQKITLAPPIARRLVPISWLLSTFLEKLRIFNTHYLVAIRSKSKN
jgi:ubiquinone/menaquinone biosynthesis C-methylase UbiE